MSKRKKSLSRLLALLLCFCMTLSILPASAFAAEGSEGDEGTGITDTLTSDPTSSEAEETGQSSPDTSPNDPDREAGDTTDSQSEDGRGPSSDEPAGPDEESPAPGEETPGEGEEQAQDRILTYEDGDVCIIVTIPAASGLPVDVQLKAERLDEDTDAYLTASERVSTDIGAGEGERLALVPYSVWLEDKDGNQLDAAGPVSVSASFQETLLRDTDGDGHQPFIACISDFDGVRFFAPYTAEVEMSGSCLLSLGVLLPAEEDDAPGAEDGNESDDDEQDSDTQVGDEHGSQDTDAGEQVPFHFGYEDVSLQVSVTVPYDAGIPADATLHVERAGINTEAVMEALRASLQEQEVQFVPYAIYFTDAAGDRLMIDGARISIRILFYEDVFPADREAMSSETYIAEVAPDGKIRRLADIAADGSAAFDMEMRDGSVIGPVQIGEVKDEVAEDFSGLPTLQDLMAMDINTAGATMFIGSGTPVEMVGGRHWTFDIYYVNEDDFHAVHKTDDFSLKYQMEFHASQNFDSGEVQIRIPRALLTYRDGTPFNPTDIAVPQVSSAAEHIEVQNSPFNYYIETGSDGVEYLVFFNYREIVSGSNAAWQVVFSHLKSMEITDGTAWDLQAEVSYTPNGGAREQTETASPEPLTGDVDTETVLRTVTKIPYTYGGSYCPGLYTEKQVQDYISGAISEEFSGENFINYKFVVWEVSISGHGNQPFDLWIKEQPGQDGKIVGYKNISLPAISDTETTARYDSELRDSLTGYKNAGIQSKYSDWSQKFRVVVAYPSEIDADSLLTNAIDVTLVPYDLVDAPQDQRAEAEWNYKDYDWKYEGDVIGIDKWVKDKQSTATSWVHSTDSAGWLEIYKQSIDKGREPAIDFDFKTASLCRSFKRTHYIDSKTGELGERIPGAATRVVTVDDIVYAYPGGTSDKLMLTGEDYYFSSVYIKQSDSGYDVYEDVFGPPETAVPSDNIDQGIKIYAMFAKSDLNETAGTSPDKWEYVGEVEWPENASGAQVDLIYSFNREQISKEPYRVMVVHDTFNYNTSCEIYVSLHVRGDSPVMADMLSKNSDLVSVQFENISGVSGQQLQYGEPNDGVGTETYFGGVISQDTSSYFHDMRELDNYKEQGSIAFTTDMYGMLLMRDAALVIGKGVSKDAHTYKTGTLSNDTVHSRANATYNLTMYEGYILGSQDIANTLIRDYDMEGPNRKSVVFYDVLPYGMKLDPSYPITAGRITDLTGKFKTEPSTWNKRDVDVQAEVVSTNYNGTGRTMVAFTVTYSGGTAYVFGRGESSVDATGHLFEGWGVNFRGYWNWKDVGTSDLTQNICAVMPADDEPFVAMDSQVYDDNGSHPSSTKDDFKPFGSDIDGDGKTEKNSVMYAKAILTEELAYASTSSIEKLVRADSDVFGEYGTSAVVLEHGGYTYDVTVTNSSRPITDIVIFDRLENAIQDRVDQTDLGYTSVPGDIEFEGNSWQGTFKSLVTQGLEDRDIRYTVYYNAKRSATLPVANTDPLAVLTTSNGWYEASEWVRNGYPLSDVKAIAVSLGNFVLESMQSVSFQICMDATAFDGTNGATWAYNNSSFFSKVVTAEGGADARQSVVGNSVRVRLGKANSFEIVKEYVNEAEIPDRMKGKAFEFHVYDVVDATTKKPYANKRYTLYSLSGSGEWMLEPGLRATDADGVLSLMAGQKAVFTDVADASRIEVKESDNPYWEPALTQSDVDGRTTFTFRNKARSVLYVQKKVQGSEADADDIYRFQLLINGNPAADVLYWKVDRAYTDGRVPIRQEGGDGATDSNGEFSMHANETLAFLGAGDFNDEYQVIELDTGDNWFNDETEWKGKLSSNGSSVVITNHYLWKDLYLTKTVNHQDAADAADTRFTFKVEHIVEAPDGTRSYEPVIGNEWTLLAGKETKDSGTLDDAGKFSCCAAAGTVRISKLVAGEKYRVTEILVDEVTGAASPEYYTALNGGTVDVVMPLYADSSKAEIVNNWLRRPLTVSKTLIYDFEDSDEAALAKTAVFEMTVSVDMDGDGAEEPLANYPFTLTQGGTEVHPGDSNDPYMVNGTSTAEFKTDADGKFLIMGSQTATFKDAGVVGSGYTVTETHHTRYEQISPADDAPFTGKMDGNGGAALFVNGYANGIAIQKEYAGADEIGKQFIEAAKSGDSDLLARLAVDIELTLTAAGGHTTRFPETDTEVTIVQQDGTVTAKTWEAGKPFSLNPWEILIITSGLSGVESFSVKESAEDQHWIVDWMGTDATLHHIQARQLSPENDAAARGTIGENPFVTLVNEISETGEMSKIRKRFLSLDTKVPTNARLILQVERYEGGIWKRASGVPYVTYDEAGPTCDRVLYTDMDGKLRLTKTRNGNPYVIFTQNMVYALDVQDPKTGDMRICEIIEESDAEWGRAVGVGGWDDDASYTTDLSELVRTGDKVEEAFVNVKDTSLVKIGKAVEGESDETFTFILSQITGVDGAIYEQDGGITPENYQSVITGTAVQSGIKYIVYDSATKRPVGEGATDENGAIKIKGGQYAELSIPEGTLWLVKEEVPAGFVLKDMSEMEGESKTGRLSDNLMLLGQDVGYRSDGLEPVAMLFSDGTMVFSLNYRTEDTEHGELIGGPWSGFEKDRYTDDSPAPWYSLHESIERVVFETVVFPVSTAHWFEDCHNLANIDCDLLDTSHVTDMSWMFNCDYPGNALSDIDVSKWDTSHVTDMSYMFSYCSNLDTLDVSGWDTSSVTDMSYMFSDCSKLTALDVSGWDTSSVTDMYAMFSDCSNLTTFDLSGLETGSVTDMGSMFYRCSSLETLDVSGWDTGSVTNMSSMFSNCSSLTTLDVSGWDTGSVTNMSSMFSYCSRLTTLDVSGWETGNVTNMNSMFTSSSLDTLDVSGWDTGSVKDMFYMFTFCSRLTTLDVSGWDTGSVTNMNSMFNGCSRLTALDVSGWDTGSVTNMSRMFQSCSSLETLDVSGWETGNTTDMSAMFSHCSRLTTLDVSYWDTGSVTNTGSMFQSCSSLKTLDVSGWETGSVKDMSSMFTFCPLATLDVSGWDTGNATDMSSMFSFCSNLTDLDVSGWDTGSVTNVSSMFYSCSKLTTLDLSGWDTGSVTNMSSMFSSCSKLTTIYAHDWTWTKTPSSSNMFSGCSALSGHSSGGISYDSSKTDCTYCKSNGGYFTNPAQKSSLPSSPSLDAAITFLQSIPIRK